MGERITIGHFGDPRREERGGRILERAVACGSLTIREICETRGGEIAVHRFLDCPEVTVGQILETAGSRTMKACAGRRIVAVQDTTEINFRGRDLGRRGLGKGGDGIGLGFFIHREESEMKGPNAGGLGRWAEWLFRTPGVWR